jgi:hypothetical protein
VGEMEVTKLSISQETQNRLNNAGNLTFKRKRQIRTEGVLNLIRSKPAGHLFKQIELIQAAGYRVQKWDSKGYASGYNFITNLIKKGIINKIEDGPSFTFAYCIPSDVKIKTTELRVETPREEEVPAISEEELYKMEAAKKAEEAMLRDKRVEDAARSFHTEMNKLKALDSTYSFRLDIHKRPQEGEFGKTKVAELEMVDVNIGAIRYMVGQLLDNAS